MLSLKAIVNNQTNLTRRILCSKGKIPRVQHGKSTGKDHAGRFSDSGNAIFYGHYQRWFFLKKHCVNMFITTCFQACEYNK